MDKKIYPRPAQPPKAESFAHRPSSPLFTQHASPPSRSFFSRSPKPSKPLKEASKIPWESSPGPSPSATPASPRFALSQPPPNLPQFARPSSPVSTHSYTSSNSSSRWSQGWNHRKTRGGSVGRTQDVFRSNRSRGAGSIANGSFGRGGEGWSEDEDDGEEAEGSTGRTAARRKGMLRQAFGLEKKTSNFSLRGLMRRGGGGGGGGGRDSFEREFSPPPSPTLPFSSSSIHRQPSSPELDRKGGFAPRTSPGSPRLPLPFPSPRGRTFSSPMYTSPEGGSVKGKAAKLLGEEIVPHGKAARLLGLERKPTLRQRPSINSLVESNCDESSYFQPAPQTTSPGPTYPEPPFDSPSSIRSAYLTSSDSSLPATPPRPGPASPLSPHRQKHRYNHSASDPFWQTASAQQHQPGARAPLGLEESIEEEEAVDQSPVVPLEPEFARVVQHGPFEVVPSAPPSPPSDPTDSIYISDGLAPSSSLYSLSLDLNHVSTFSTGSNPKSALSDDSPVEHLITRSSSSPVIPQSGSFRSVSQDYVRQSRRLSRTSVRASYSPTSPSHRNSSRLSAASPASSLTQPDLPPPSSALPPLPNVSTSSSLPSFGPSDSRTGPPRQPLPPLPVERLPLLPLLEPLPSFLSSPTKSISSCPPSSPVSPVYSSYLPPPPPPSPQHQRRSTKPNRSNTLASVASVGTRRKQHDHALEALEGRREQEGQESSGLVKANKVEVEGTMERGSRKRAAIVRRKNREEHEGEQEESRERKIGKPVQSRKGQEGSFLDLEGSDDSDREAELPIEKDNRVESEGIKNEENETVKFDDVKPSLDDALQQSFSENSAETRTLEWPDRGGGASGTAQPEEELGTIPETFVEPIPSSSRIVLLTEAPTSSSTLPLRRISIASTTSCESRRSDSSDLSNLPSPDVTASSFPRPPSGIISLPYLSP